ncbi:DUF4446 family protein [Lachnospiraceae bacterium ZAX-1]
MNFVEYFGINLNDIVITIIVLIAILFILLVIIIMNLINTKKLKKKYNVFMLGKDVVSLEDTLISRLEQVEELLASDKQNKENIEKISNYMKATFQKVGMVKYDAFNEMGGKLSFSLALLNKVNDGFIINAMHSREGCYTYIKEILNGNSFIILSEEEKEALDVAMGLKEKKEE